MDWTFMKKEKGNFNDKFSNEAIFSIYEEKVISLEEKNRQLKNKIERYETILNTLNIHKEITMDVEKLGKLENLYEERVISLEETNRHLKNKIEQYETIMHTIQMHREITMDREKLVKLLELISAWSYAHRFGNGELYEEELQENVDRAFKNIMNFITGKN
jgi:hypothetical protein